MMKPDLVCVWPVHLDYPLFRQFIRDNRERFAKIIVVLTNMNAGKDYREWLKQELSHYRVTSIDSPEVPSGEDWRNVAVHQALLHSDSEWLWFVEQDFFPQPDLWEQLTTIPDADIVGVLQDKRLHPCCLFIKREVLEKTSMDFSAHPPEHDHFGQIQKDLDLMMPLYNAYTINPKFYEHLNGLSQNMYLLQIGQEPNHQPERFQQYLKECFQVSLPLHDDFVALARGYLK